MSDGPRRLDYARPPEPRRGDGCAAGGAGCGGAVLGLAVGLLALAGLGNYGLMNRVAASLVIPYATLWASAAGRWGAPGVELLALGQFPVYGVLAGVGLTIGRLDRWTAVATGLHVATAIVSLAVPPP